MIWIRLPAAEENARIIDAFSRILQRHILGALPT